MKSSASYSWRRERLWNDRYAWLLICTTLYLYPSETSEELVRFQRISGHCWWVHPAYIMVDTIYSMSFLASKPGRELTSLVGHSCSSLTSTSHFKQSVEKLLYWSNCKYTRSDSGEDNGRLGGKDENIRSLEEKNFMTLVYNPLCHDVLLMINELRHSLVVQKSDPSKNLPSNQDGCR